MKNWMRDTPEMVKMLWVEFIGKGKGIIISPADKPGWFEVSNYTESPDGDLILNGWDTAYAITGPASWAMCAFVLKVCGKIPEYPNVFSHDDVKTLGKVEGLK
jgi:hypothetical protein